MDTRIKNWKEREINAVAKIFKRVEDKKLTSILDCIEPYNSIIAYEHIEGTMRCLEIDFTRNMSKEKTENFANTLLKLFAWLFHFS